MNETRQDLPVRPAGGEIKEFMILTVLTVGLFLSGLFAFLTPAPAAFAIARRGAGRGWVVPAGAALLGSLIFYPLGPFELGIYLLLIAMGVLIGRGFLQMWPAPKTVGISTLLALGGAASFVFAAYLMTKGQIVPLFEHYLRGQIGQAVKLLGAAGSARTEEIKKGLLEMVPQVVGMLPGIFISSTLMVSWANLLLCRRYCRGVAPDDDRQERLCLWKSPEHLVWVAIAAGLMFLVPSRAVNLLGSNVMLVIGTVYFFQGLAVVAFYFEKWRAPIFVKGFICAVLLLEGTSRIAVAAMGLFDVWFDFRKRDKQA